MTKILLVEDDKSLREIYGVRLLAEGYQIISAGDGEQALAMAVKERPDLIISDVMMPKISGFDMLDILRATPETKDLKVIMMTALSSEDQRSRGENLGANRYLVKSQVGIEDVVRAVHDVLADSLVATNPTTQPFAPKPLSAAMPVQTIQQNQPEQSAIMPSQNEEVITNQQSVQQPAQQPIETNITPSSSTNTTTEANNIDVSQNFSQNPTTQPIAEPVAVKPVTENNTPSTEQPVTISQPQPSFPPTPQIDNPVPPQQITNSPIEPSSIPVQFNADTNTPNQQTQDTTAPEPYVSPGQKAILGDRVINPINNTKEVDISALINQELNTPSPNPTTDNQPPVNSTNQPTNTQTPINPANQF